MNSIGRLHSISAKVSRSCLISVDIGNSSMSTTLPVSNHCYKHSYHPIYTHKSRSVVTQSEENTSIEERLDKLNSKVVKPEYDEKDESHPDDDLFPNLNNEEDIEKLRQEIADLRRQVKTQAKFKYDQIDEPSVFDRERVEYVELEEDEDFPVEDVDMDGNIFDLSSVQQITREVMSQNKINDPYSRLTHWCGLGEEASKYLPDLPKRQAKITELDWRTFLNLQRPELWFPLSRMLKRKIIIHAGPTNSGKTHGAMKRLAEADSGLFCGPLRLLAFESYERLNANGVKCSLLTGQEIIEVADAQHISCTVEMCNLERIVDVAVIDEIQMIQSEDRGYAWVRALLGLPAKEIHLCGDATSLEWILELAQKMSEDVVVQRYQRLSPVSVEDTPVTSLKHLKRGDCVIAFGRKDVHYLKSKIEENGMKVAVIYGTLPPAVRKLQADMFNDPESGVDILVASDAIGMGLNLNIGRVIFSSIFKFDGNEFRKLTMTEVKQIGGRAGRFNSEFNHGKVSVLYSQEDLQYVRDQFEGNLPPMENAFILPTAEHMMLFNTKFPHIKFSRYLTNIKTRGKLSHGYGLGDVDTFVEISEVLDEFPDLDPASRVMLCYAPFNLKRFKSHHAILQYFASNLPNEEPIPIPPFAYICKPAVPSDLKGLSLLEETYQNLDLYVWLAYRVGDTRMPDLESAKRDRALIAELIHSSLSTFTAKQFEKGSMNLRIEHPDGTFSENKAKELEMKRKNNIDVHTSTRIPENKFEKKKIGGKRVVMGQNGPIVQKTNANKLHTEELLEELLNVDYSDVKDVLSGDVDQVVAQNETFINSDENKYNLKDYLDATSGGQTSYAKLIKGK